MPGIAIPMIRAASLPRPGAPGPAGLQQQPTRGCGPAMNEDFAMTHTRVQPCAEHHSSLIAADWLERRARHEFFMIVGLVAAAAANIGWFASLTMI